MQLNVLYSKTSVKKLSKHEYLVNEIFKRRIEML